MTANLSYNPYLTTNAAGSFQISSTGYIQGVINDDPALRYELAGGVLATSETLPMWGGVGIGENVPGASGGPADELGGTIIRATSLTNLTGFSVFNQNHAMVNSPQSPVPLAGSGMLVNFFRLGSGIRLAVACDPTLASLEGGLINQQVSWDFANQELIAYDGSHLLPVKVLDIQVGDSMTVTYNSGTNLATWNRSGTCALIQI